MIEIKKSSLIKIPQDSFLFETRKDSHFLPIKKVEKPEIGIYLKCLDDQFSEVILGDKIFVVENFNIFLYKENNNVY